MAEQKKIVSLHIELLAWAFCVQLDGNQILWPTATALDMKKRE